MAPSLAQQRRRALADHVLSLMQDWAAVDARSMFGGFGLYRDGQVFGLIVAEQLYFKVDALTQPEFEALGLSPFTYETKARTVHISSYWSAPAEVWEDPLAMHRWAQAAYEAAKRTQAQPRRKAAAASSPSLVKSAQPEKPPKSGKPNQADTVTAGDLSDLLNLGPASVAMLCQAGIRDRAKLSELGAVRAYVLTKAASPGASLNLLWSLEGALSQRPWQDVAEHDRASLLMALEDAVRHFETERRLAESATTRTRRPSNKAGVPLTKHRRT